MIHSYLDTFMMRYSGFSFPKTHKTYKIDGLSYMIMKHLQQQKSYLKLELNLQSMDFKSTVCSPY